MTDTQLYLGIGLPVVAVLTSLISLIQISGIREDMRQMRGEFHSDLTNLTGKVIEVDNRLTRIEERMEHK